MVDSWEAKRNRTRDRGHLTKQKNIYISVKCWGWKKKTRGNGKKNETKPNKKFAKTPKSTVLKLFLLFPSFFRHLFSSCIWFGRIVFNFRFYLHLFHRCVFLFFFFLCIFFFFSTFFPPKRRRQFRSNRVAWHAN